MRFEAARREDAYLSNLSVEVFLHELAGALVHFVPQVRIVRIERGLRFGRGSATADVSALRPSVLTVVLRHSCERVLGGGVLVTADGLNELAADLVGFFCGAPLVTLALYPRDAEAPKPARAKRRRPGPYDAPLIPLPFDPPLGTAEPRASRR